MKKIFLALCIIVLLSAADSKSSRNANIAKKDYVPNEQTAIKVAEAIWLPIYGESIYEERPFTAYLSNNIWYVSTTKPDSSFGGVAVIEIRRSDCKILSLTHTK